MRRLCCRGEDFEKVLFVYYRVHGRRTSEDIASVVQSTVIGVSRRAARTNNRFLDLSSIISLIMLIKMCM